MAKGPWPRKAGSGVGPWAPTRNPGPTIDPSSPEVSPVFRHRGGAFGHAAPSPLRDHGDALRRAPLPSWERGWGEGGQRRWASFPLIRLRSPCSAVRRRIPAPPLGRFGPRPSATFSQKGRRKNTANPAASAIGPPQRLDWSRQSAWKTGEISASSRLPAPPPTSPPPDRDADAARTTPPCAAPGPPSGWDAG